MTDLLGASRPETVVEVSREDFAEYWRQLERRWPVFFNSKCVEMRGLPSMDDVHDMVTFIEVPKEYLETCTYRKGSNEIRIGDDKWTSGCVAHEIGHAVCDLLGLKECREFEHPNYKSRC